MKAVVISGSSAAAITDVPLASSVTDALPLESYEQAIAQVKAGSGIKTIVRSTS